MRLNQLVKCLAIAAFSIAFTVWQYRAGLARCGAVDGGILLLPLLYAGWCLVAGVIKDLKELKNETT